MPVNMSGVDLILTLAFALGLGVAAFFLASLLLPTGSLAERARRYAGERPAQALTTGSGEVLRQRTFSLNTQLDAWLRTQPIAQQAALELARARLRLRVGEYFGLMLLAGIFAAYAAMVLTRNTPVAVAAAAAGAWTPRLYMKRRQAARVKAIDAQLVDMLQLSANSLRAGWSFLQALEHVAAELPPPLSEEIQQVLEEVSLGATAEAALEALQQRVPSYDLELIVTAVLIQRRVGGNLAEMLDTIAHTIRERVRLVGELRTLTAEARLSTWILALMPVALLAILLAMNPRYVNPLFSDARGQTILMAAAALELVGVFVLRRMGTIRV